MKFDWSSCAVGVIAGAGAILCVIFAMQLDIFVDTPVCAADENGLTCARGWVNAVAVVAAAGTIFFLYRQLREQTKQTAFMVGDADPTFDVFSEDGLPTIYFRVVNWNRRTLVVDSVSSPELNHLGIYRAQLEHADYEIDLQSSRNHFDQPIRVAAFDDRSRAPAILRLEGVGFGRPANDRREISATFELKGRLLGDHHQEVQLVASGVIVHIDQEQAGV